jgi:hypothetical protein
MTNIVENTSKIVVHLENEVQELKSVVSQIHQFANVDVSVCFNFVRMFMCILRKMD